MADIRHYLARFNGLPAFSKTFFDGIIIAILKKRQKTIRGVE